MSKKLVFSTAHINQDAAFSQNQSPNLKKMMMKIDDASQQDSPEVVRNYDIPPRIMTNYTDNTQTELLRRGR